MTTAIIEGISELYLALDGVFFGTDHSHYKVVLNVAGMVDVVYVVGVSTYISASEEVL